MSFLGEIKRRKVFQVAVVYIVVAWVLVQVITAIEEPLSLPAWSDTLVIVLLTLGFPVTLIMGWAFDLTPAGVVRTPAAAPSGEAVEESKEEAAPAAQAQKQVLSNSVAVLPFDNLSPDPDNAYFAAGIHEAILNELAKIADMNVIARTSVLRYAGATQSIQEIAEELNVQTVMEGSVQYADNDVRITAQLIDATTGAHLWSEVYDREFAGIFAIQTDIASRIAASLEARLTPRERTTLEKTPTSSPDAYALYLKAIATIGKRSSAETMPEASAESHALLDKAIELDPGFAVAHALKAVDYATSFARITRLSDELPPEEKKRLAVEHAEAALALDPDIGLAHDALAQVHRFSLRNEEAKRAFERAEALSPNSPQILHHVATFNAISDDVDKAIRAARRCHELDPVVDFALVPFVVMFSHDPRAVLATVDELLPSGPTEYGLHAFRGIVSAILGETASALSSLRLADELRGERFIPPYILGLLAYGFGRAGAREEAMRLRREVDAMAGNYHVGAGVWALFALALADEAETLRLLKEAAESPIAGGGYVPLATIAENIFDDPTLEKPEFVAVRKRFRFRV